MPLSVRTRALAQRATLLTTAVLVLAGCYTTRPLLTREPAPGQRVVLQLTDRGSVDMARLVGPNIMALEGTVSTVSPTEISLRVTRAEQRGGMDVSWSGEPIAVPTEAIAGMQERNLDKRRSWAMAGIIGALAITLGILIGTGAFSGSNSDSGGPPA